MTNKITQEERGRIVARAKQIAVDDCHWTPQDESGVNQGVITNTLIEEFGISRDRARSAAAKAIRQLRGEHIKRNRAGSPPNTSLILSAGELAFIQAHYGGEKSRAIHDGLKLLMDNRQPLRIMPEIE